MSMAENRKGKENRFYFSRSQMVLLGATFVFASLIIFVLGVFVGKGIEGRKLQKKEEPLVRIPVKPGAQESSAASPPQQKNEITFNDTLPKAAAAPAPEDKPAPAKPEKIAQAVTKQNSDSEAAPARPSENKAEKSARADESAKKVQATAAQPADQGKVWRAQVNAFPDDRSARQIVDRLKNKGYNAYVTEVENRGKTWYRVNVGKYSSRDEADKMVELLRNKENYPKAFAASR
jgi:cell division septation protein DedD